jgi:serine incorporator 1/3
MLAWAMRSRFAINLIEKWSYDYIKMDCEDGKCYGVLAVRARFLQGTRVQ